MSHILTILERSNTAYIDDFVKSNHVQNTLRSAAIKAFGLAKEHHKYILANTVTASMYHVAGLDFPSNVHVAIHHEIEYLATNLGVAKSMAHSMLHDSIKKLKASRAAKEALDNKNIDDHLEKLSGVLDTLKSRYTDEDNKTPDTDSKK